MRYLILILLFPLYSLISFATISTVLTRPTAATIGVALMSIAFLAMTLRLWWLHYWSSDWQTETKRTFVLTLLVKWVGLAMFLGGLYVLSNHELHVLQSYRPKHAWLTVLLNFVFKVLGPHIQGAILMVLGGWVFWVGSKACR